MEVWGHRGANYEQKFQNTLTSLEHGLKTSHGIETDCVVSAQKTVYLIHDITATSVEKLIKPDDIHLLKGLSLEELPDHIIDQLTLLDGSKIPTLKAFLEMACAYTDKTLNLELKSDNCFAQVLETVQNTNYGTNKIIYSSFNHDQIKKLQEIAPSEKTAYLYEPGDQPTGNLNTDFLHIEALSYFKETHKFCSKNKPITLWTYGSDVKAHENEIILEGIKKHDHIHAIIVDYPEEMIKVLS